MKQIEDLVNYYILATPPKKDLDNLDLEVDLNLAGNGIVITDSWLSIPLEGTFHPFNNH